jgi:RNA polymerase sigma-70 factor (ECF subfamily)
MRRVRDRTEIDDMVQQVFERLLKRGDVTGMDRLSGYVFQTASSVLADHGRRRRSRHADAHDEFDESAHGDVDFSPEHVLLGRERLARATAILLELPERTRVIFVLRRLEGMKYLDIAARLGISVSAVEKHMERAVARLMDGVGEE